MRALVSFTFMLVSVFSLIRGLRLPNRKALTFRLHSHNSWKLLNNKAALGSLLIALTFSSAALADQVDLGANDTANTKIKKGGKYVFTNDSHYFNQIIYWIGASTLQAGITKTITRGVNLDRSDFSGQNLKGMYMLICWDAIYQ